MSEERVKKILSLLEKAYPDAGLVLHYRNPLELLVATILAAQCTDERVKQKRRGQIFILDVFVNCKDLTPIPLFSNSIDKR